MRKNSVLLVLLLGMAAAVAKADTFNLVTAGTLPVSPSYGTVTLTQVGGNVTVNVTLVPGDVFISTGAGNGESFLFDLDVSPITVPAASITTGYSLTSSTSSAGGFHADGSGNWDYGITCGNCGPGGSNPLGSTLSFTVDGVKISDFIKNPNFFFAADVCVTNGQSGCPGGTGIVDSAAPTTSTPEPSSLALLATPALSFSFMAIRRRLLPHWKQ